MFLRRMQHRVIVARNNIMNFSLHSSAFCLESEKHTSKEKILSKITNLLQTPAPKLILEAAEKEKKYPKMTVSLLLAKLENRSEEHDIHLERGILTNAIDIISSADDIPKLEAIMDKFGKEEMHLTEANWNRLVKVCARWQRLDFYQKLVTETQVSDDVVAPGPAADVYIMRYYENKGELSKALKVASEIMSADRPWTSNVLLRFRKEWLRYETMI